MAARVHELQVALAQEPSEFIPLEQVNKEHADYRAQLETRETTPRTLEVLTRRAPHI